MSIRFVHIRKSPDSNGTTVAYVYNDKKQQLHFGVAKCSEKDKFSRPVGRKIASSRIRNGNIVTYDNIPLLAKDSADPLHKPYSDAPTYREIASFFYDMYGSE